jgi:hypothetical protein
MFLAFIVVLIRILYNTVVMDAPFILKNCLRVNDPCHIVIQIILHLVEMGIIFLAKIILKVKALLLFRAGTSCVLNKKFY